MIKSILVAIVIIAFGVGYYAYSRPKARIVQGFLKLDFVPGDRVLATQYKQGGIKIENAAGTVIGLNYNPVWDPKSPIYYYVVFDDEIQTEGSRSAHGYRPDELKLNQ